MFKKPGAVNSADMSAELAEVREQLNALKAEKEAILAKQEEARQEDFVKAQCARLNVEGTFEGSYTERLEKILAAVTLPKFTPVVAVEEGHKNSEGFASQMEAAKAIQVEKKCSLKVAMLEAIGLYPQLPKV